jgi:hypothetical protein
LIVSDHFYKWPGPAFDMPDIIKADVAERAERILFSYVVPAGVIFYDLMLGAAQNETTRKIASFILTSSQERFVSADFKQNVHALRGLNSSDLFRELSKLETLGWLVPGDKRGSWTVPKNLRAAMAERRRVEASRKADAQVLMQKAFAARGAAKRQARG